MSEKATLTYSGKSYEFPVQVGSENELGMDISQLRAQTGLITLDEGYANTGSCDSKITYIDGERGILRYRGYTIEELVEYSSFTETAYLLIFGELPTPIQLQEFHELLTRHQFIHENMRHHFQGFPASAPPMAILSAMINTAGCFQPELVQPADESSFMETAAILMSKVRTIAAASYKTSIGEPIVYPRFDLNYTANFLHMMFCMPNKTCHPEPEIVRALDQIFILHADHEQNCSTSTVRMVGSSQANLYASAAAGICALWGPLHGGANVAVIKMLERIHEDGQPLDQFIEGVKRHDAGVRLMGFGHRVYKNYDPRAKFIKKTCHTVLNKLGIHDPLLELAVKLEEVAVKDPYFVERKLYPNVDFYSGIILRAIGIPVDMFTVMFAIGRMPGWIANWREVHTGSQLKIYRPRQIYSGSLLRSYEAIEKRK
ncbi:MAG: Citrate synthase 1 [Phycisphaerae bacterium]|nr:Citrate synthase 1 [Phycisphaerae bacterium]